MITIRTSSTLLVTLLICRLVHGHGVPIRIKIDAGSNQVMHAPFEGGEITESTVFGLNSTLPGIGALDAPHGLSPGSIVSMDVTQGLLFWDGSAVVPTSATVTVQSAQFTDNYVVTADSPRQTGLRWATFDGTSHWHAHGIYFLSPSSAEVGIYGLAVQVTIPNAIPSDPFVIPFVYDPDGLWTAAELDDGVAALESAMIALPRGDFDRNWSVDDDDFTLWKETYGQTVSPFLAADGNGDGRVSAADFTVWRDHRGAPGSGSAAFSESWAVPEAASWKALLIGLAVTQLTRRSRVFPPIGQGQAAQIPVNYAILFWHHNCARPPSRQDNHEERLPAAGHRIVSSSTG